jgi:uridylate kinase
VKIKYNRILLKLSGEALLGERDYGIDPKFTKKLAEEIKEVHSMGVQIAIVVGGGNIFRGVKAASNGMDRSTADYMGMLATLQNAMALKDAFESVGVDTRLQSALNIPQIGELYIRQKGICHLEKGRIVILACGTGNPFFTTDTAAALRALELDCDVLMKATKVDGVYDKDPVTNEDAVLYKKLDFTDVLVNNLHVMDASAISLCRDNNIPIKVFNLLKDNNIKNAITSDNEGTIIFKK